MLPALSGVLLALSFPPLHPLLLPFIALVPFAAWVAALPGGSVGRGSVVRGAIVLGTVYFGTTMYWILVALWRFTSMAIPAYVAVVGALVLVMVCFGWLLHRAVHDVRIPLWLALPVVWTAAEWFRAHWPGSLALPWLGLGTSLTGFPELVGIAELVGARGVTFWIVLVNGLIAGIVIRSRGGLPVLRSAATCATVVALPMMWGVWRADTLSTRVVARAAIVQPNIPEEVKRDPAVVVERTMESLEALLPRLAPGSVDLVILPEATLPVSLTSAEAMAPLERLRRYGREVGAPLLFGALGSRPGPDGTLLGPYNSAYLMGPRGLEDFQYDKHRLVPMVERMPLLPERWIAGFEYFGSFRAGEGWPLASVDEALFGVLICYEAAFAPTARALRLEGADVLVNLTNDAWYGREARYTWTTALWQHPAHLVMRAIENRMGVARSANTGISFFVDPVGRIHEPTPLFQPDVRSGEVLTTDILTAYARFGDLVGNGSAAAALLILAAAGLRGRSRTSLDPRGRSV